MIQSVWKFWAIGLSGMAALLLAGPAPASDWAGNNGLVRLSFSDTEELTPVLQAEADSTGGVMVDLYAVLTDVEPMVYEGERFLGLGGMELELVVEGADPIFADETYNVEHFNISQRKGSCQVGFVPGLMLTDGRTMLVHWRLLFMKVPRQVVFRLDPNGMRTCKGIPACDGCGAHAIYVGTSGSGQHGFVLGAGYTPAYLNWKGDPDLAPVQGAVTWQDVGLFTVPEPDE